MCMSKHHTKSEVVEIYKQIRDEYGTIPLYRDFCRTSGIGRRKLDELFGASSYSKLQELAGDAPNKLELQRTELREIMLRYADLATEMIRDENRLPVAADWAHRRLRPTESGLTKTHGIKWADFPDKFLRFCESNKSLAKAYKPLIDHIVKSGVSRQNESSNGSMIVDEICRDIQSWMPAQRRNSEEAYKSELSLHLRTCAPIRSRPLEVREEHGDSLCDIAIGTEVGIELKKAPTQADYDRCFGQVARHLCVYKAVVVAIFDASRKDAFEEFCLLVDRFFGSRVRVVRNG